MICETCEGLYALMDRYRRERDEARSLYQSEHCHRLSLQSEVEAMRAVLEQAERERDEARAKFDHECLRNVETMQLAQREIAHWKRRTEYAFERGAEAMREACAEEVGSFTAWNDPPSLEFLEEKVRALPIPGEP